MGEFIIIAGLSGAGRSTAADTLDDLGWFVIDNLPLPLFEKIVELTAGLGEAFERIAFVLGAGSGHSELPRAVRQLRATNARVRVLFLDASSDVLVRRYEETRRRHPQRGPDSLVDSIYQERLALEPVKAEADVVVDTSDLNVHQLSARVRDLFGDAGDDAMQIRVSSFGYKRGLPLDVDLVFDCRFLPNPHWVAELRPLDGRDAPVRDYVLGQALAGEFLDELTRMLDLLLPAYVAEGKAFLTIAFGCTGGQHRSVAIAEEFSKRLEARGHAVAVTHRDVDK